MNTTSAADLTNAQLEVILDLRLNEHGARRARATKMRAFIRESGRHFAPDEDGVN
jgi:hypothetical protein